MALLNFSLSIFYVGMDVCFVVLRTVIINIRILRQSVIHTDCWLFITTEGVRTWTSANVHITIVLAYFSRFGTQMLLQIYAVLMPRD